MELKIDFIDYFLERQNLIDMGICDWAQSTIPKVMISYNKFFEFLMTNVIKFFSILLYVSQKCLITRRFETLNHYT